MLNDKIECPRCGADVDAGELFEFDDSDPSTGYYATETACPNCDPKRLALEREAAEEFAYWDNPGWADVFVGKENHSRLPDERKEAA